MANRHNTNSVETLESIWRPGPNSQFFRSPKDWEADPRARVYGHQLRRAWDADEGLGLWAVLCVEGKPTVYFKRVDRKQPELEQEWQRRLWNQGAAAMLVVQDPNEVRIYSGLARPEKQAATSVDDLRLIQIFDYVAHALELDSFIRSVESGQFYRDHATKFSVDRAVDKYLLNNLGEARNQLCDQNLDFPLSPSTAHTFLGRCLFTCYLLERRIIGKAQLSRAGAKGDAAEAKTLKDLLGHLKTTDATDILYRLFRVLKDDFNGSMFSGRLAREKQQIRKRHLDVLYRFLRGDDMKTQQSVLFPLYDFRFIQIEFISAIYEDFLAAEEDNEGHQEVTGPRPKGPSSRRKIGAYYTPPRLAELVVDIATEGWPSLLNKRCLDPACGSGIFLVILFQRMAEEWRRRNPKATNTTRARALREILTNNLCGVDVNETACMVACFSLYLAFMDQFDDPRDIWELASELRRTSSEKVLPLLVTSEEDNERPTSPAIHVANFFGPELPHLKKFHLVIANPPWVGRNQPADQIMERWLLDDPQEDGVGNPFIRELAECPRSNAGRRRWFLPNRQVANAYMWKTPLHVRADGTICLLLPSKVLLANQVDQFQAAWFSRFEVSTVWQLADFSFILFPEADCPAIVARFSARHPTQPDATISYITPKVSQLSPYPAEIIVLSDDRKAILLNEILEAARENRSETVWKKHFWGVGRDQELIDRLLSMPKLSALADRPGKKRWSKGVGFQPYHQGLTKGGWEKAWWDPTQRYLASDYAADLVLLKDDCAEVGQRFRRLRRSPDRRLFSAPMVVFNRACNRIAFADFPVIFQDSVRAISGPPQDRDLLLFLAAVLNSSLGHYFLFHTSANWGVERDTVLLDEYLRIAFPLPDQRYKSNVSRAIVTKVAKRLKDIQADLESLYSNQFLGLNERRQTIIDAAKLELDEFVNDYYDLSRWERTLVQDTVKIFEPSSTPSSLDTPIPTLQRTETNDHRAYADLLCETLNRWLGRQSWKLTATAFIARTTGLGLLILSRTKQASEFVEQSAGAEFEDVLSRIQKAVDLQQKGITYSRGFVLFEPERLHVLKPLTLRHWTMTAALNDADALMSFMATRGGRR